MDKRELAVSLYKEGKSTRYLANKFGVSDWTIRYWLEKAGVPRRNKNARKYYINDSFLNNIEEEQAYFLGYMITDGYVNEQRESFSFRCHKNDRQLIEDLLKVLNSNYPIRQYGNVITVEMKSKQIVQDLIKFGITQRKTFDVKVPKIPQNVWLPFIRGVIDGDGSIGLYEHKSGSKFTIRITSGSKEFLEGIKEMIAKLYGEEGYLYKGNGNAFVLSFQKKSFVVEFLSDLYKNSKIHLERKRNISIRGIKKHGSERDKETWG